MGGLIWLGARTIIEKPPESVEITFFSTAPPPPPPPPPASTTKKKKKKKEKKEEIRPEELVQPQEIPEEEPEPEPEDEPEEEVDGGVVGGVEGGQIGGVIGGEIGGVEGGVVGGDIASLGIGQSRGLCTRKPNIRYPEQAKQMGIEGTVKVRILVGLDGKIAKKKDEYCKAWHAADKKARRMRWHPRLCIEAISGPETLYYETLVAWGTAKFRPWKSGNVFARYWGNITTDYKLK
jgi:protein TonB